MVHMDACARVCVCCCVGAGLDVMCVGCCVSVVSLWLCGMFAHPPLLLCFVDVVILSDLILVYPCEYSIAGFHTAQSRTGVTPLHVYCKL